MKKILFIFSIPLLNACTLGFEPEGGNWSLVGDEGDVIDTCGFGDSDSDSDSDEDTQLVLDPTEDGFLLRFDIESPEDASSCTLDGKDFTCESLSRTEDSDDTVFTIELNVYGSFDNATEGFINMSYQYSCEGDYCSVILPEENPCEISISTSFQHADL